MTLSVALVGNPNCGKSTLFNALTGARQKVGNWPGVTVERKSGYFTAAGRQVEVVDLPGVYSLVWASDAAGVDERVACEYILQQQADVIINIVDASHLERHLYLTIQLLEMGVPVIVALNMMDIARAQQVKIDLDQLSQQLGCPVVALAANKGNGIAALKQTIVSYDAAVFMPNHGKKNQTKNHTTGQAQYPVPIQQAIQQLATYVPAEIPLSADWLALYLLEGGSWSPPNTAKTKIHLSRAAIQAFSPENIAVQQAAVHAVLHEDVDILVAEARYQAVHTLMQQCVTKSTQQPATTSWSQRLDNIVLNRWLGIPIFLFLMYSLFVFSINIGGAFQDFFDISGQTLFVDSVAYTLTQWGAPSWLIVLLAQGIGKGINTTITFIPVIGALFLFLAFLEDSGYMARAAFVIDRVMRAMGLPGKAFVPMIVGFGCNVPAIMAARTLENKRDRILTIMMSPFMSCGARLAIYAVFIAAFFPRGGQNIVFALYLIGILMAVLTGFILRKTVLKGEPAPLIMELPSYHLPRPSTLLLHAWQRLKGFVFRAGKLIVPICVLIGALNSLHIDGTFNSGEGDAQSLLSHLGQWVTPIFTPMGIYADNWPATVGLVTGILAKEVVVGTLNTLYAQMGQFANQGIESFNLWAGLQAAWQSIPDNFAALAQALTNPVLAKAPIDQLDQGVYGLMYQRFDGQIGAFAYLLFVLLYFPCVSTTA
ncbi:MAG TPA: Fe(2+) transporter permease subunit FeoB, partial [Gammaproteobacteria bacterium]|nr:Fe(2+) transporter permease subunit FeoB [Gammaproteobacteria bacterium]